MSSMFVTVSMGRPKHVRVMAGGVEGELFLGPKAEVISDFIIVDFFIITKNFGTFNNCCGKFMTVAGSSTWPICKSFWQHNLGVFSITRCDVTAISLPLLQQYRVLEWGVFRGWNCIPLSQDFVLWLSYALLASLFPTAQNFT